MSKPTAIWRHGLSVVDLSQVVACAEATSEGANQYVFVIYTKTTTEIRWVWDRRVPRDEIAKSFSDTYAQYLQRLVTV